MNPQFSQPGGSVSKDVNKQSIARVFGVKMSEVAYLKVGLVVDGYKILYDKATQTCWERTPSLGNVISWSLSGNTLEVVTSSGVYTLHSAQIYEIINNGSSNIVLPQGGVIRDAIPYVTPEMFRSLVINGDWEPAIEMADSVAANLGVPLKGFGKIYNIGAFVDFTCDNIDGIGLRPLAGYTGAAASFTINQVTGKLRLNVDIQNFQSYGCKVYRGSYTGIPSLILDGCVFNNNGSLLRTTCVNPVNTATDFVIDVTNSAGFAAGNMVWVGDSKCTILSISGNTITLVNDGTKPILLSGGTGTGSYAAGQFFTKNGDGKNGITIGNGGTEPSWDIRTVNGLDASGNAWFGVFQYVKAKAGSLYITGGVRANDNGYCGLGLSYAQGGEISGFTCNGNGNNGLDIFETNGNMKIHSGEASLNGVDGVFACGNGTGPKISGVTAMNNKRIGILAYGRTEAPTGFDVTNCNLLNNGLNSLCYTGIRSGSIADNVMGGTKSWSLKMEGKNGLLNPMGLTVCNNTFEVESVSGDIFANIGGYTDGGNPGIINVTDNKYNNRNPVHSIASYNRSKSLFRPSGRMGFTSAYTAAVGRSISVSLSFIKPDSNAADISSGIVEMQIGDTATMLAATTVSSATRNAGVELYNGATTNGKIIAAAAYGALTYSFTSTTAKTVYLKVRSPWGDAIISLTWS